MKIKCDVCDKEEASVFCSADEAPLCDACDRRVHHANKLASKHLRFSLQNPSSKDSPRCDICQERRALLFCKEDRAILCRECDIPIHKASEHTQRHTRFLLTGVKLSAAASSYQASPSSVGSTAPRTDADMMSLSCATSEIIRPTWNANASESTSTPSSNIGDYQCISQEGTTVSASSISEYLMETLPGWQVEDFLDPSYPSPYGFCKGHDEMPRFEDYGFMKDTSYYFSSDPDLTQWVPQASPAQSHYGVLSGVKGPQEVKLSNENGVSSVPRMSSTSLKKSRRFR